MASQKATRPDKEKNRKAVESSKSNPDKSYKCDCGEIMFRYYCGYECLKCWACGNETILFEISK